MGETALALGIAALAACAAGKHPASAALGAAGTVLGLARLAAEPRDTTAREGFVSSALAALVSAAYLAGSVWGVL